MNMRTIKFRGENQQDKWLYGDLIHNRGKVYIAPIGKTYIDFSADDFEVETETIGQYTGLKDNNGVEIYEGDVVRLHGNKKYTYIVEWVDNYGAFLAKCVETGLGIANFIRGVIIEVLGNIYDNPELIEKED